MWCKLFVGSVVAFATILVGEGAMSASVQGFVRDRGKASPANGISGARVWVRGSDGMRSDPVVVTDTTGEYQIINVANGVYTLVVEKYEYIPIPFERPNISARGLITEDDVLLMRAYASNASYWSVVASGIMKRIAAVSRVLRRRDGPARF